MNCLNLILIQDHTVSDLNNSAPEESGRASPKPVHEIQEDEAQDDDGEHRADHGGQHEEDYGVVEGQPKDLKAGLNLLG